MKNKNQINIENERMSAEIDHSLNALDEQIPVPVSVSPTGIKSLIGAVNSEQNGGSIKCSHRGWKRFATVAASIALVAALAITSVSVLKFNHILPTSDKSAELASNDNEIYQYLKTLKQRLGDTTHQKMIPGAVTEVEEDADVAGGGASYGQTNVQVDGVDEGDIIKNDGRYLYMISDGIMNSQGVVEDGKVIIAEALYDGTTEQVSIINFEPSVDGFYPTELYVSGNTLVVVGYQYEDGSSEQGYSDYGSNSKTAMRFYDIANRAKPAFVREYTQSGGMLSTRLAGKILYVVSANSFYIKEDLSKENYKDYLPKVSTYTDQKEQNEQTLESGSIRIAESSGGSNYVVISAIDLEDSSKTQQQALFGAADQIYATTENLYITGGYYNTRNSIVSPSDGGTSIFKYSLSEEKIKYVASGLVKGHINDQFSMNERNGKFFVATTSGWSGQSENGLYALDENLKVIGKLEGLAKGESIKSVRYINDTAYVVTYRQVDPLFAIDISNPAKLTVMGQLKIPGFSSYMHPIDENTLIGIGEERSGNINGVKISLFDVEDPKNLKESDKLIIGGYGQFLSSSAQYDHKSVMYDKTRKIMGICIRNDSTNRVYILLVKVDPKTGIQTIGELHPDGLFESSAKQESEEASAYAYDNGYGGGYSTGSVGGYSIGYDTDFDFQRATYIGNTLYAFSNRGIASYNYTNLKLISVLNFE